MSSPRGAENLPASHYTQGSHNLHYDSFYLYKTSLHMMMFLCEE